MKSNHDACCGSGAAVADGMIDTPIDHVITHGHCPSMTSSQPFSIL